MSALDSFHPAVAAWFSRSFAAATPAQEQAWPAIQAGHPVLVAAPTGSGKTFAAFLAVIDQLVREGIEAPLPVEARVLYISPLKALSNDIHRNLEAPLAGIREELARRGLPDLVIRAMVRTGDTPQAERARMRRQPPHIVVTTPESLYILLGSKSGREMLRTCRTAIVDEIHAVAGNKRGAHLALSLERLDALAGRRLVRIGLSATQKPIDLVARYLVGGRPDAMARCAIVDAGHRRQRDLALELPPLPLEPVMSGETWNTIYDRLAELAQQHRTTLVFVNTRRLAERVARHLAERVGESLVATHHGSLSKERRLDAEQRLKRGELTALVATASLELGLDIGDVDLVCQIGSTRSINAFLQRVGRSGHSVGGVCKGRLFPLSRDELVECVALLDAVQHGELDRLVVPTDAMDVLAQQLTAEIAAREWSEDALFELVRGAYPYSSLPRQQFDACIAMLSQGFNTRRGRQSALIHHDAVNHLLRPRKGAGLTALTSGGAIPDNADYRVMLEPEGHLVGTLNEDFAVESLQGDIFQLGNTSYRILRVERGTVRVEDAHGQPPSIPFWLGEAPGRTDELSAAVSRLRRRLEELLGTSTQAACQWLVEELKLTAVTATQLVEYLAAGRAALGVLPSLERIVIERFFDESGGMQLVIHTLFGSRVNRAWGLALRKCFCRTFNFELQAAATEDHIVLSLTHAHSFELAGVARYLHSNSARSVLIQALCASPMFGVRWRWGAGIALALPRFRGGKKVAPQIARMNAEDLLASVFPDQVACAENLPGEIEVPEHPLVHQVLRDCLEDAMDVEAFEAVLRGIESGAIAVTTCDLTQPSPLALEALNARPYAFLDDAPLEERRTQAVMARRWLDTAAAADLGKLDAAALERVRREAWPEAGSADELHDALSWLSFMTVEELHAKAAWPAFADQLGLQGRVLQVATCTGRPLWIAAERRAWFEPALPGSDDALREIVRGRLQGLGPVTVGTIAATLNLPVVAVTIALIALEGEGFALRGRFTPDTVVEEWCERRLLARIHRYTVTRLRAQIEPVQARDYLRFLFEWQRLLPEARVHGSEAVGGVLAQLEGFEAAATAWESDILPSRIAAYEPQWLDDNCRAGRFVWARFDARPATAERGAAPIRSTPIALLSRRQVRAWSTRSTPSNAAALTSKARAVHDFIAAEGASFFDDIADQVRLLPAELEDALAELVALGMVNSDSFNGLRALLARSAKRGRGGLENRRRRSLAIFGMQDAGRWATVRRADPANLGSIDDAAVEHVVRTLLRRWGVISWKVLQREADWLPAWRDILKCCRRLEDRGEIRGGRFIAGFSGEQYATAEAVGLLREIRRRPHSGQFVSVSAADPLNLLGIMTPGARLSAVTGNRLLYLDGLVVATRAANEIHFLAELSPEMHWQAQNALLRRVDPLDIASAVSLGNR